MKRHGLKLTYTFCLGGLSFFLFIVLTITGIFLMFFYRPAAWLGSAAACATCRTSGRRCFFGDLVRNMHRWGAHLMVLSSAPAGQRVLHGLAQAAARVQLGDRRAAAVPHARPLVPRATCSLGTSSIWAVTVGTSLGGYAPFIAKQTNFLLLGGVVVGPDTLLRWYVLHVLALPFVLVIFLSVHFWRIRKDGGISGPL